MSFARSRARRGASLVAFSALLVGSLGVGAFAQDLPACDEGGTSDCRLPDWSDVSERDLPSLFGEISGIVWQADARGDAPADGLDILGAGLGRVDITEPGIIRESERLLKSGQRKKAVQAGPAIVVRVVLDRPVDDVGGDHSGIHVATDIDGSRSNNAPTGVAAPDSPFAGSQDVYSLTWASTTGQQRLLASDLAKGWYKDKSPFAAAWAAPNVLDLLVAPEAIGEGFRVITHVDGEAGGYDSATVGLGPIVASGEVGYVPTCYRGLHHGRAVRGRPTGRERPDAPGRHGPGLLAGRCQPARRRHDA